MTMLYQSTKTYGHEQGLSCCFRQWRAQSHCNQLHGYAIAVTLVFEADSLDGRNWVVDFGSLKSVKAWLQNMFDHTTLVARDDPSLKQLEDLFVAGVVDLRVVDAVGCEAFARMIHEWVSTEWLPAYLDSLVEDFIPLPTGLHLSKVEVREHGANSASVTSAPSVLVEVQATQDKRVLPLDEAELTRVINQVLASQGIGK